MSYQRLGAEFLVNTTTVGNQGSPYSDEGLPAVAALADGGFVATWTDYSGLGGDESGPSIKAQLFDAAGGKVGSEFLVNTITQGMQITSAVAALSGGGFVITWSDLSGQGGDASEFGVKAQIFSASGAKIGSEFLVNDATSKYQIDSSITGLTNGGFVIAWQDGSGQGGDTSGTSIKAQMFDASGAKVGPEFLVNTITSGDQYIATTASLLNGGFVVTWYDESGLGGDASHGAVKAQLFDSAGAKIGSEFLVNTTVQESQFYPTIASLANGGFVVAWWDYSGQGGDASGRSVKAQIFDADGAKVGSEFLINTTTNKDQIFPTISPTTDGGFAVAWTDYSGLGGDADQGGIRLQLFDADGHKVGSELLVNTTTVGDQQAPAIATLESGNIVIIWQDASGQGFDTSGSGLKAQLFALKQSEVITNGERGGPIFGTPNSDVIEGRRGDDKINAGAGNDTIAGGSGRDVINAGSGNDTIVAAIGDGSLDIYAGGAGSDTLEMSSITVSITIDLGAALPYAFSSQTGLDMLSSIENFVGGSGNDLIIGSSASNRLAGGNGNDTIRAGGGNDIVIGGAGNDMLSGQGGNDTFVFAAAFGNDRVLQFDANPSGGQDHLDISAFGITVFNFSARVTIADVGADTLVIIDSNAGQTIRLVGIGDATVVTQSDFVL